MAMSGICGQPETTKIILRNGLDYEKKVVPPDYSNVPSVRDWQMSPFGNERYDLDEIQKSEKLGFKHRFETERLKKLYGKGGDSTGCEKPPEDKCEECFKRKEAERQKNGKKLYCTSDYLYQPYGPIIVSSVSYSRPDSLRPGMYSYLGPSSLSGFSYSKGISDIPGPVPCDGIEAEPPKPDFRNVYIPYGPLGGIRFTKDTYVPMGPSNYPLL